MTPSSRLHYMDGIRALAMMAGVLLHCLYTYGETYRHLVPGGGPDGLHFIDSLTVFLHSFRMQLFFLVSGFFACLLVQKRGLMGFLKNRSLRILLPFMIFLPIVMIVLVLIISYHITEVEYQSLFTQLAAQIYEAQQVGIEHPYDLGPRSAHLWFLYYLLFFGICTLVLAKFSIPAINQIIGKLLNSTIGLWLVIPALSIPGYFLAIGYTGYLPAPDSLTPQFWPFALYGVYYLLGWFLFQNMHVIDKMGIGIWWKTTAAVVLYLLLLQSLPTINIEELNTGNLISLKPSFSDSIIIAVVEAYLAFYLVSICLYLGKKCLSQASTQMRYISDASYWVYIVHLPIAVFMQVMLIEVQISIWIKMAAVLLVTLSLSFLSYQLLVRHTPIGWMLNGRKKKAKSETVQYSS